MVVGFVERDTATVVCKSWRVERNQQTIRVKCSIHVTDAGVIAVCNMTDGLFEVACPASDPNCAWDPAAESSTSALCARLCSGCA